MDDGSGFENRRGCKPTVGSNPTSSAMKLDEILREMAQGSISESELKANDTKLYDTHPWYMKSYPYKESADEKEFLDKAMTLALREQALPEEMDAESFGITMDCSPPLKSKSIKAMSASDTENMNNIITVLDVMEE